VVSSRFENDFKDSVFIFIWPEASLTHLGASQIWARGRLTDRRQNFTLGKFGASQILARSRPTDRRHNFVLCLFGSGS
jgi:hypothetical protein